MNKFANSIATMNAEDSTRGFDTCLYEVMRVTQKCFSRIRAMSDICWVKYNFRSFVKWINCIIARFKVQSTNKIKLPAYALCDWLLGNDLATLNYGELTFLKYFLIGLICLHKRFEWGSFSVAHRYLGKMLPNSGKKVKLSTCLHT